MNERRLRKITVALLALGIVIVVPTQLADYKYSQEQWVPPWSFFVYISGIVLVFIGLGMGVFISISSRIGKGKGRAQWMSCAAAGGDLVSNQEYSLEWKS